MKYMVFWKKKTHGFSKNLRNGTWLEHVQGVSEFLSGGNSNIIFIFTPTWGKISHFDLYLSDGLVQPPTCFNNMFIYNPQI